MGTGGRRPAAGPPGRLARVRLLLSLPALVGVATVLGTVFIDVLDNPVLAIVGALLLGLAAAAAVGGSAWERPLGSIAEATRKIGRRLHDFLSRYWLALAAGAGVFLVVVPVAVVAVRDHPPGSCPDPTEVRVLTSSDGFAPAAEVAREYERQTAREHENCPTVRLFVYAPERAGISTPALTAAVAGGWRDSAELHPARDIGPRPDVYLPDSSVRVAEIREAVKRGLLPDPVWDSTSVASSPVVLGLFAGEPARPDTGGKPATDPRARSWSDLMATSDELGWRVVRPAPTTSVTGAIATLALYQRGRPGLAELTETRQIEQRIQAALTETGNAPTADTEALLCHQRRNSRASAIVTSEQALIRFDRGAPLTDECGPATRLSGPDRPLLFYPPGTAILDFPFVRFTWTRGERALAAVKDFRDWLLSTGEGKKRLRDVGLRPPNIQAPVVPRHTDRRGELPETLPSAGVPPAVDEVAQALTRHQESQSAGRVVLAVDTSGSMNDAVGGSTSTRREIVAAAVRQSLGQIGVQDEFGLWAFPADRHGVDIEQLVPVGPGNLARRQDAMTKLAREQPSGGTPLYGTIVRLAEEAAKGPRSGTRALVVVTDGEDTTTQNQAAQVRAAIEAAKRMSVQVIVVAVGDVRCQSGQLAPIGGATCYQADFWTVGEVLRKLFRVLWGGRR